MVEAFSRGSESFQTFGDFPRNPETPAPIQIRLACKRAVRERAKKLVESRLGFLQIIRRHRSRIAGRDVIL